MAIPPSASALKSSLGLSLSLRLSLNLGFGCFGFLSTTVCNSSGMEYGWDLLLFLLFILFLFLFLWEEGELGLQRLGETGEGRVGVNWKGNG